MGTMAHCQLEALSELVKVTPRSCNSPSRPWPLQIRLPSWPWTWWESSQELQSETGHLSLSVMVWADPIRIFDSVLWETTVSEIFTAHVRVKEECIYALPGICICPKDLNSHKSNCHLNASLGHFFLPAYVSTAVWAQRYIRVQHRPAFCPGRVYALKYAPNRAIASSSQFIQHPGSSLLPPSPSSFPIPITLNSVAPFPGVPSNNLGFIPGLRFFRAPSA